MTSISPPKEIITMANDAATSENATAAAAAAPRRSPATSTSSSTNAASIDGIRQQRRRRRRVAFNETTRILVVPGLWQFPEKVKRDIFYDNDYLDMKDDIRRSARAARKGRAGADDCIRGIEHLRSRSHIEERRSSQRAAIGAVLTTQDRLREDGRADATEIARASMCRTRKAKDRARDLAIQDEEDADQIYAASEREARRTAVFAALNAELGDNLAKLDITCRRNL